MAAGSALVQKLNRFLPLNRNELASIAGLEAGGDAPISADTEFRARPRSGAGTYRHAMAELANASAKMIHNPLGRSIHAAMLARPNLRLRRPEHR
jgi:hypothetical protein